MANDALRAALAVLEQARAGMLNGRVASENELEAARLDASQQVRETIATALSGGPEAARSTLRGLPPWARDLADARQIQQLEAIAGSGLPVTGDVVIPPLGTFQWLADAGCYVAQRRLRVGRSELVLSVSDVEADELATQIHAFAWLPAQLEKVTERARQFAATNGLDLHNAGYLEAGVSLTTRREFCDRLTPTYLSLEEEGAVFTFDDGDLFWGHGVVVECSLLGDPREFSISG